MYKVHPVVRHPLTLALLLVPALAVHGRGALVTVSPGDAFRDSLALLGAGDTLFFSPGIYTSPDSLPLLHVTPSNDGVVITSSKTDPAVLDGQDHPRPVLFLQGPLGSGTLVENLVLRAGNATGGTWFGGGGIFLASAHAVVRNCTVEENLALLGGGVYAEGGAPELSGLLIRNNEALVTGGGGCFYGSDPRLEHSEIRGNSSLDDGGGLYTTLGDLWGVNLLLTDNYGGDDGGGIMAWGGRLFLEFTTIHGNACFDDGGGVLVSAVDSLAMLSCIVTDNTGNGGIQRKRGDEPVFFSHCNVWNNQNGNYLYIPDPTGTQGNISENPLYADTLMRLSQTASGQPWNSPCVDSGHRVVYGSPVEWFSTRTDSIPDGGIADMGYHFNPYRLLENPPQGPLPYGLSVAPCPAANRLFITVTSPAPVTVRLRVVDVAGRVLTDLGSLAVTGEAVREWAPASPRPGVLFIHCSGPQGTVVRRVVILP